MTLDEFVVMFPEFADYEATLINAALVRATRDVDDTWFEGDQARAQGLLAAHHLVMAEEVADSGGGAIASEHIGEISRSYVQGKDGTSVTSSGYWPEFAELRRKNHPPIIMV